MISITDDCKTVKPPCTPLLGIEAPFPTLKCAFISTFNGLNEKKKIEKHGYLPASRPVIKMNARTYQPEKNHLFQMGLTHFLTCLQSLNK
jgi:hypothetical protein